VVLPTFKGHETLRFLASSRDRVITRESLLSRVWGHNYYGDGRTVDVHIGGLQSKIADCSHNSTETVRNVGYEFRGRV
jgi:two-component system alkaline phosphatase synthesis response regulator PhoP